MRILALVLSLGLHAFLATVRVPEPVKPASSEVEFIEVDFGQIPPETQDKQQVIRDSDVPEEFLRERLVNDQARFLSAETRRVTQEMRAERVGKSKNRIGSESTQEGQDDGKKSPNDSKLSLEPTRLAEISAVSMGQRTPQFSSASPSTVGEILPDDIEIGQFTVLNADQFTYYSFFSRIEDLIRFRWESSVRSSAQRYSQFLFKGQRKDQWRTQVRVILNKKGEVESIQVIKGSGLEDFDLAAAFAFRDAKVFPNPPAELVGRDGRIVLDYGFAVLWSPSYVSKN